MIVRNNSALMTMDQIRHVAPSAFATAPREGLSSRYAFIPTSSVIEGMSKAGFHVFAAGQSRARGARGEHTKHVIRFRHEEVKPIVGLNFPEVVLTNAHDGSSQYKLMAGIFRFVCGNGMVVAESTIGAISVRHSGNVIEEVAESSAILLERMPIVTAAIGEWRGINLTDMEQVVFADAAHTLRYGIEEDKADAPIPAERLLTVRRGEDDGKDLWSTFNRIQENVIQGGLNGQNADGTRRMKTRAVTAIDKDTRLNQALWQLAEGMANLKKAA